MLSTNPPDTRSCDRSSQNCSTISEALTQLIPHLLWTINEQSRKTAVKFIQMFPSQVRRPLRLTLPGMLCVSISSVLRRTPSLLRKPTIIFGTPKRKDWAQIRSNFRSNFIILLSFRISSAVLSSIQFVGWSLSSDLQSHTAVLLAKFGVYIIKSSCRPASTSPPRIKVVLPISVCTTEQYCS